jgi:hypothetical protein
MVCYRTANDLQPTICSQRFAANFQTATKLSAHVPLGGQGRASNKSGIRNPADESFDRLSTQDSMKIEHLNQFHQDLTSLPTETAALKKCLQQLEEYRKLVQARLAANLDWQVTPEVLQDYLMAWKVYAITGEMDAVLNALVQ